MDGHRNAFQSVYNQMFKLSLVAIIAAGFIFSSCNRERNVKSSLADIETYIDEHPDSALKAINSIDTNAVIGRSVKAKYALLKSIALDKNYIDTADTRIIAPAVEYYRHHDSEESKAKSFYYLGRMQQNAKDYNLAIVSFTKAEEYSGKAENYYVKGLVQRCIADIYNHTYQNEDELRYHRMAYASFKKAGKLSHSRYELLNIAYSLQNQAKFADAEKMYCQLLSISRKEGDTNLMAEVLYSYSTLCVSKDRPNPEKAVRLIGYLRDTLLYRLDASNFCDLAYAYAIMGEKDKALASLKEADKLAVDPAARAKFLDASYNVFESISDYRSANENLKSAVKIQNSLLKGMLNQSVNVSQKEYFKQRAFNAEETKQSERKIAILSVTCLILLLIILTYMAYKAINQSKESIKEYQIKVRDALLEKEELSHQLEIREIGAAKEFKDKFEIIGNLIRHHYEYSGNASARMKFEDMEVKKLLSKISGKRMMAKLEVELDEVADGIMTKFRKEFPELKDEDYCLILYWFLGFPVEVISLLMNISKDKIYSRKNRLKERISLSKAQDKEQFLIKAGFI